MKMRRLAREMPTRRGRRCVPPAPGMMARPARGKGKPTGERQEQPCANRGNWLRGARHAQAELHSTRLQSRSRLTVVWLYIRPVVEFIK